METWVLYQNDYIDESLLVIYVFSTKIEKESKQNAKEAGLIKTELTGAEVKISVFVCFELGHQLYTVFS